MAIPVRVFGGSNEILVSRIGQLATAPFDYDETKHLELADVDVAYNFYPPKVGHHFIITGLIYSADQQVALNTGATVIIYEASSILSTTIDKVLHQDDMIKNDRVVLLPLNLRVTAGKFLNAKTDDDDIHMTIMGYYIPSA